MKSVSGKTKAMMIFVASMLVSACSSNQQNRSGVFEDFGDVGDPLLSGSFDYNPSSSVYTLTGGGTNMWFNRDEFFMAWKQMHGDFSISAQVDFEGEGVNAHRKMGVIIRESLTGESKYADIAVHGDGLTSLQYRDSTGGDTKEVIAKGKGFDHLTLERIGTKIIMKVAKDGFSDIPAGEIELELPDTCYVGIFICSHEADVLEKACFSDVQLNAL